MRAICASAQRRLQPIDYRPVQCFVQYADVGNCPETRGSLPKPHDATRLTALIAHANASNSPKNTGAGGGNQLQHAYGNQATVYSRRAKLPQARVMLIERSVRGMICCRVNELLEGGEGITAV